jgi:hypothetical protein
MISVILLINAARIYGSELIVLGVVTVEIEVHGRLSFLKREDKTALFKPGNGMFDFYSRAEKRGLDGK